LAQCPEPRNTFCSTVFTETYVPGTGIGVMIIEGTRKTRYLKWEDVNFLKLKFALISESEPENVTARIDISD
jgi:hypothetical protein